MIFKNIISTTGTRILNAIFSLIILLLMTNFIGKQGLGAVGLIIVDVTVIQLLIDLLAGSALVYFASRESVSQLLIPSYIWILIIIALVFGLFSFIFQLFPSFHNVIIPNGFDLWILILALANGWMQTHYNLLIGLKRIKTYNLLFLLQITLFLAGFVWMLFVENQKTPDSYIKALFVSWLITGFLGLVSLKKEWRFTFKGILPMMGKVMQYGIAAQAANVLHIGNKRLSFYFVKVINGLSPLGVLTAAVQLTEGLRIIGQSIALVQFSAISNSRDDEYARILTIKSMKFTLFVTLTALVILLLIPASVYGLVFSQSFMQVKSVIFALSPGVLALASNAIFSHYFSGTGQPKINFRANISGFIVTIILAVLLIRPFGIVGAAFVASGSYLTSAIHQYIIFRKQTRTPWSDWLIRSRDFSEFYKLSKNIFSAKQA